MFIALTSVLLLRLLIHINTYLLVVDAVNPRTNKKIMILMNLIFILSIILGLPMRKHTKIRIDTGRILISLKTKFSLILKSKL